jgi:hypothetical protein
MNGIAITKFALYAPYLSHAQIDRTDKNRRTFLLQEQKFCSPIELQWINKKSGR